MKAVLLTRSVALFTLVFSITCAAERVKDLASVAGVRSNQLIGYGLVVGLDGSGDQVNQTPFTTQSFSNMLRQFGVNIPDGVRMQMKNVAAVSLNAELPAFAKAGQALDVTVSSIGNAKSLRGGVLLMSPLKGADGQTYAIAQGSLVVGGFGAEGADGSKITVNVPSVGRIPNGATVEREVKTNFDSGQPIVFNLHRADFTSAKRLAESINDMLGPDIARPVDSVSVMVDAPVNPSQRVNYLSMLENIRIKPGEAAAKVIINSRTGTIVVGQHVTVSPVAVTHGSLTVTISEDDQVSQPGAFGEGETVVTPKSQVAINEEESPMFKFEAGTTLDQIVRSVNEVGASPGDLMAILEAMKQAGALQAELIVI